MHRELYDRVQTNLTALNTYGLSAATQTALLNAINAFVAAIPSTRIGKADKKSSTAQLATAFKNTDAALANIDAVVEIVRTSQANFYAEYKSVRKIIETGKGSLSMKGKVSDALNGEGLKGATLTFSTQAPEGMLRAASATVAVVKKTAKKGGFNVKSLPDGMYTVSITKVGYAPQEATVAVEAGELTVLDVQLSKS